MLRRPNARYRSKNKSGRAKALTLLFCLSSLSNRAFAADQADIVETKNINSLRLYVSGSYFNFSRDGKALSGFGPEAGIEKALGSKLALGFGIGQSYGTSGKIESLFTSFAAGAWYAVTGRFTQEERKWTLDGRPIATYSGHHPTGLRIGISTQQYIFNASASSTPFSGVTLRAQYEFHLPDLGNTAVGAEFGRISNQTDKANLFRIFVTILLPINFR
ncbi:MAG: hypothetical protein EOP07_12800 [Proteobacteria bacterium]|nr:MAG: hypothetical protein EOP07_12800 [Pseudomonadota bacterium]